MIHVRQIKKQPILLFVEQSNFEQFTPTQSNDKVKYRKKNPHKLKLNIILQRVTKQERLQIMRNKIERKIQIENEWK